MVLMEFAENVSFYRSTIAFVWNWVEIIANKVSKVQAETVRNEFCCG